MSMGTKLPSGMFNTGYTQPYGSSSAANMYGGGFGGGTYDPMLGFGQASGMGTTFNYPNRYSADYTRYAQSGMPFNQPVMGYNSYGQIFAQPQRPPPTMGKGGSGFRPQPPSFGGKGGGGFRPQPPAMGGKGGGGFQPGYGYQPPQQPPTMGGKGGPQPRNDRVTISYPGGSRTFPRSPERRTNQLGLNNEPSPPPIEYPSVQVPANQTGPVTGGPGATPPPLVGGVPADSVGGFGPGATDPRQQMNYALGGLNNDVRFGPSNPYTDDLVMSPVQANRQVIDENIYNSPFGQLIGQPAAQPAMAQQGANISNPDRDRAREINMRSMSNPLSITAEDMTFLQEYDTRSSNPLDAQAQLAAQQRQMAAGNTFGLGGMSAGRSQDPNLRVMGERNFDMQGFNLPPQSFDFGQGFGRMAFQEGGQVPPDANMEMMVAKTEQPEMAGEYDRLIQMTMQAILGQVESPDEVIQMFIDEFGVDAFRQLRDAVLKQQVPGAQTEGMVNGNGGGMDDQVMGMIGNQRPVAVSPGEYIVPADVVSGLGDGSSQAGADILDELNQAVRMTRTGTTQQPRPLMEALQQ